MDDESFLTGYQYNQNYEYIGEYRFPLNKGKTVHLSPNTTLTAPAHHLDGKRKMWNPATQAWEEDPRDRAHVSIPDFIEWEDLTVEYLAQLKKDGLYDDFVESCYKMGKVPSKDEATLQALTEAGIEKRNRKPEQDGEGPEE